MGQSPGRITATSPLLLLLNGAPGVGKSTLARRLAADTPGMAVVDVDAIRTALPDWRARPETKLEARRTALDRVEAALVEGRDVVVPQLLARPDFAEELAAVAAADGARFLEVVLRAPLDVVTARFLARRRTSRAAHPEGDLDPGELKGVLAALAGRTGVLPVDASGSEDQTYVALRTALLSYGADRPTRGVTVNWTRPAPDPR
jgi:predicted kinase